MGGDRRGPTPYGASPPEAAALLQERAGVVPDPGDRLAVAQGCTCPVDANRHGVGLAQAVFGGPGAASSDGERWFRISLDCPLHGRGEWLLDMM